MHSRLLALATGALLAAAAAVYADGGSARLAPCFACHGPQGKGSAGVPAIGGQPAFYVLTQLFLFREGRRDSPPMAAVAKGLSDADLQELSQLVAALPPPAPAPGPIDGTRYARGERALQRHRCGACHGADFSGSEQVPRLAHQREAYLLEVLRQFKRGARLGYTPAMTEVMSVVDADELAPIAHYLAHVKPSR